jgi:predicted secreted protein
MAAFHGKQGKVTFATTAVSNVLNWSIDATCDFASSSVMSNVAVTSATHWADHLAGYKDWTATVECDVEDTGFDPDIETDFIDQNGVACVFHQAVIDGGFRKYSGNGIITGILPSLDKSDVAKVTYSVQGSGTLAEAADVT